MTAPFILHLMGFWDHLIVLMFQAHIFCARGNVWSRLMHNNYIIHPGIRLSAADVCWNVINIPETAEHMLALLTHLSQKRNLSAIEWDLYRQL